MNSWALWRNTIELLGKEFRLYALDFFGFGDSGAQAEEFSVSNFTLMVDQFMDRMGIVRAPLVGHSMGGTVSLSAALRKPEKVVKVIVIGSPIKGTSLSLLLQIAGYRGWIKVGQQTPIVYAAFQKGLSLFLRAYSYLLARDGRALGDMLTTDVAKISAAPFFESIGTLRETDLRPRLRELQMPVMGIYGTRDLIVHPGQAKVLKECLPNSTVSLFEKSGHFPMMDESERFHATLRTFLHNSWQ